MIPQQVVAVVHDVETSLEAFAPQGLQYQRCVIFIIISQ
jgi:hypothetical protein